MDIDLLEDKIQDLKSDIETLSKVIKPTLDEVMIQDLNLTLCEQGLDKPTIYEREEYLDAVFQMMSDEVLNLINRRG